MCRNCGACMSCGWAAGSLKPDVLCLHPATRCRCREHSQCCAHSYVLRVLLQLIHYACTLVLFAVVYIAERVNGLYGGKGWKKRGGRGGRVFKVPEVFIPPAGARVMSLQVRDGCGCDITVLSMMLSATSVLQHVV